MKNYNAILTEIRQKISLSSSEYLAGEKICPSKQIQIVQQLPLNIFL